MTRRTGSSGRKRALAEKATDEEAGRRMLRLAADYEKLAERADAAKKEMLGT